MHKLEALVQLVAIVKPVHSKQRPAQEVSITIVIQHFRMSALKQSSIAQSAPLASIVQVQSQLQLAKEVPQVTVRLGFIVKHNQLFKISFLPLLVTIRDKEHLNLLSVKLVLTTIFGTWLTLILTTLLYIQALRLVRL